MVSRLLKVRRRFSVVFLKLKSRVFLELLSFFFVVSWIWYLGKIRLQWGKCWVYKTTSSTELNLIDNISSSEKYCSEELIGKRSFKYSEVFSHLYCAFHKHANSKVQRLLSIISTITSNEPCNTETHKTDRNLTITNHKPWPFEPVKEKYCLLKGPLGWLTAAKNAIFSSLLNFTIRIFCEKRSKKMVPRILPNSET